MADNPIDDLLVRAYPNPRRVGCPGKEALLKLIGDEEPLESDLSQHVWHCSPCFQEFRALRDTRRWRERRGVAIRFGIVGLAAATLLLAIYLPTHVRQSVSPSSTEVAELDFSQEAGVRGADGEDPKQDVVIGRRAKCCLLLLPSGNASGDYEVQIRTGSDETKTIRSFFGLGKEEAGRPTKVECKVGYLSLRPQSYVAAWRLRGSKAWHYGIFQVQ